MILLLGYLNDLARSELLPIRLLKGWKQAKERVSKILSTKNLHIPQGTFMEKNTQQAARGGYILVRS